MEKLFNSNGIESRHLKVKSIDKMRWISKIFGNHHKLLIITKLEYARASLMFKYWVKKYHIVKIADK